jgi:hypothetical protein
MFAMRLDVYAIFENLPKAAIALGSGVVQQLYPHGRAAKLRFQKMRGGLLFGGKFCRRFHQVTDKHHRKHLARSNPSVCVSRNADAA